jgi:hypothetical protein
MAPASSSSSATEPTVAGLLAESFVVLASELPPAWTRFSACLDGCTVEIHVDGESFTVGIAAGTATIAGGPATPAPADALLETTRRTIEDVLDARLSLREAVMHDALQVVAPLAMMSRLHAGILAYVHGGVRCPSFPALLKRFRALPARPDTETDTGSPQ